MTRTIAALIALALGSSTAIAQQALPRADTDGDGIPDAIEQQLATDPNFPEPLELLYEDGTGETDTNIGAECVPYGDYARIWFAPVARGRYLWKIDLASPTDWPPLSHDVRILYVDADNDPSTGRPDAGPGCDIMFYIDPARENRLIDWSYPVGSVTASDGNSIYLCADVDLNQADGRSVFRMMLLYQDIRDGHTQNRDSMPYIDVSAAGESDREPIEVPSTHPLFAPPQELRNVGARVLFDHDRPRAEITFVTELPTMPTVDYGPTAEYGLSLRGERPLNNHRIYLEDLDRGREYHYRVSVPARGEPILSEDATFTVIEPGRPACSVARERVTLTVDNPHSTAAASAPITTGLPFPQGVLGGEANLRLLDEQGRELPLQTQVTARYPDGSVQWLLLDFIADIPAQSTAQYTAEFGREVERTVEAKGIALERAGEALIVDTGALAAVVNPQSDERVRATLDERFAGRLTTNLPLPAVCVVGEQGFGSMADTSDATVEVERRGPLVTVIRVSGAHANAQGEKLFRYVTRYSFTAGSGLVRVQHTLENDRTEETLTRVDQYMLGLRATTGDDARVTVEGGEQGPVTFDASAGSCVLTQDLDNHWSLTAPGVSREGEAGPSAIDISDANGGLWVGMRHFAEKWPSGLFWHGEAGGIGVNILPPFDDDRYADLGDAVESDRLYYHVRDGGYRLHWGESFTREIWLGFHEGNAWPQAWAEQLREPLIAVAEPEWMCASGAFGEQLPRTEGLFPEYEQMVDRIFDALMARRETNRSYGFLNFGDWWGERQYNWGNMEYDTPHAQMVQFARTGDRRFFDEACNSNVHNRDVDYAHYEPNGREFYRTRAHRMFHTGGYEPRMTAEQMGLAYATDSGLTNALSGHQWNRGGFDHYFMTGEQRSYDVALGLAEYMAGPGTVSFTMGRGAERAVAWALYDVMSAYRVTWDPYYLNAARIMVEDVIRRQTPEGHWAIPAGYSKVEPLPIGGYAWCSGLLITWLHEYNRYARDPRVDETILRAAQWLARDEFIPEKKGFRSCSCDTFNEVTRPGGSAWGVADAMAIAYELSGDEKYLDLAQMTYAYYARTGSGMGKDYSVALVTSPHLIARLHAAGRTDLDVGRWEEPLDAIVPRVIPPGRDFTMLLRARRSEAVEAELALNGRRESLTLRREMGWVPVVAEAPEGRVEGAVTCGEQRVEIAAERLAAVEMDLGDGTALIASGEDFLGPALEALGVDFERLAGQERLERFGAIFLGTQACTLDSGRIRTNPAPLLQWLHAGGTLVVSHPNDERWDPLLFGPMLLLQEENATLGEIADTAHPLFAGLEAAALAGAQMFDSVAEADEQWQVLARDAKGRPAILELPAGRGRALVMVPSLERYVTGELAGPHELNSAAARFMANLLEYVK